MEIWVFLILGTASLAGSGLIYLAMQRGRHKQQAYEAFATAQGGQLETDLAGRSSIQRFRDPVDDWTLDVVFVGAGASGGSTRRRVIWQSPQGALYSGEAVLGLPLPEKAVAVLQGGGLIAQQVLKGALKATIQALGQTKFDLVLDETSAGDPGGVVMASGGQADAMDRVKQSPELAQFRKDRNPAEVPVILRDTSGLSLRRSGPIKDLTELVVIVELGKALRARVT